MSWCGRRDPPDLAATTPRHLLDRRLGAADPRPQAGESGRARRREARRGGGSRHRRGGRRQGVCRLRAHLRTQRRHGRVPPVVDQARRLALGAGARGDAGDSHAQQAAPAHRGPRRRRLAHRTRRRDRRAARRRIFRVRHRHSRRGRLRDGAPVPPEHLPDRHRHAAARAAREVPRHAGAGSRLLHTHRRGRSPNHGVARRAPRGRSRRPRRAAAAYRTTGNAAREPARSLGAVVRPSEPSGPAAAHSGAERSSRPRVARCRDSRAAGCGTARDPDRESPPDRGGPHRRRNRARPRGLGGGTPNPTAAALPWERRPELRSVHSAWHAPAPRGRGERPRGQGALRWRGRHPAIPGRRLWEWIARAAREYRAVWRDVRPSLRGRRRRRSVCGAQLRCGRGDRRRGRPLLRVHDRGRGCRVRAGGPQFCGRHVERHRLRARRAPHARVALQPGNGCGQRAEHDGRARRSPARAAALSQNRQRSRPCAARAVGRVPVAVSEGGAAGAGGSRRVHNSRPGDFHALKGALGNHCPERPCRSSTGFQPVNNHGSLRPMSGSLPMQFKIALVQMRMSDDPQANLGKAVARIREAAQQGATLVCLPELFRTHYIAQREDHELFDLAEAVPGPTTETLGKIAKENGIVVIASLFERRAAGLYHNTAAVIDADGKVKGIYRKMHIPDDPSYYEKFYFTPGDLGFRAFDTKVGPIGALVCWDQWYPEGARITALQGANILLYPTAIGWHPSEKEQYGEQQLDAWKTIQRSHAIANGCWVAAVNRVGVERLGGEGGGGGGGAGSEFWGHSFVCDPFGVVIAEAADDEALVLAQVDLARIEEVRRSWPFLRDRRIDAYGDIQHRFLTD